MRARRKGEKGVTRDDGWWGGTKKTREGREGKRGGGEGQASAPPAPDPQPLPPPHFLAFLGLAAAALAGFLAAGAGFWRGGGEEGRGG